MTGPDQMKDLRLTLRENGDTVEARLEQSGDGGPWRAPSESGTADWLRFDWTEELATSAENVRDRRDEQESRVHGEALWRALEAEHQRTVALRHDQRDVRRFIIQCEPGAPEFSRRIMGLAWESLLALAERGIREHEIQFFGPGGWQLLRQHGSTDPAPADERKIRILLLLTSLTDDEGVPNDAIITSAIHLIDELRTGLAALDCAGIEFGVAAAADSIEREGETRILRSRDHSTKVDRHFGDRTALRNLFSEPREVVVTFGHSDAEWEDPSATALKFWLEGEVYLLEGAALRDCLANSSPLRLVVALNCASQALAGWILETVPHFVATTAMVDSDQMAAAGTALFKTLSSDLSTGLSSIGSAVSKARDVLKPGHRPLWTHSATTMRDDPFLDEVSRALATDWHKRMAESEFALAWGTNKLRTSFATVHVALSIAKGERVAAEPTRSNKPDATPDAIQDRDISSSSHSFENLMRLRFTDTQPGGCWILRGDGGAGKTTTLRYFELHPGLQLVPIYLSLPHWLDPDNPAAPTRHKLDLDSVFASVEAQRGIDNLRTALANKKDSGQLVFLLDGFDELSSDDSSTGQRKLAEDIAKSLAGIPTIRVVLGARHTAEIDDLGPRFRTARLQPLGREQKFELLRNLFDTQVQHNVPDPEALAKTWAKKLETDFGDRIAEMAGNPLLLTFFADRILSTAEDQFDAGRHEMLREVMHRILTRSYRFRDRGSSKFTSVDAVYDLLAAVAWHMLHQVDTPRRLANTNVVTDWFKHKVGPQVLQVTSDRKLNRGANDLPEVLAEETFFRPEQRDGNQWGFSHNLLQEALCAEHWWNVILRDESNKVEAVLAHLKDRLHESKEALDFWTEPTALLAGWMQDDALLVPLLRDQTTRDLGLRVMRALDRVSNDTWNEVLNTLPAWRGGDDGVYDDLGPRAKAYEAMPRKQLEADDLSDLIESLKSRATAK